MAVAVAEGVASPGGPLAWLAPARGEVAVAEAFLGSYEVGQQGLEFGWCHAGEALEGTVAT